VTVVYPDFALGDAETTRQVLLKHLVGACTGLPRQDCEWLFNFATATPALALALLATMQPTTRFDEVFQYGNLMAAAAGYIAAYAISPHQELGAAYDEAMRTKVFEPLAMMRTTYFGKWHSSVASRRNDDGTTSFILIDPTAIRFDFVVGERDGKQALIIHGVQHEYAFIATTPY
jgi:CubicO group peptidase (beta-lactamase class C family)